VSTKPWALNIEVKKN